MKIRAATFYDAPAIKRLLGQLGYPSRLSMLIDQLEGMFNKDDHQVLVYELRKEVVGFVSVHYLPQLAIDGGMIVISCFSVDEAVKNTSIDKELEHYITNLAKAKKCECIQVHCMDWQVPAHQFYIQQGYQECPKYFSKRLIYSE